MNSQEMCLSTPARKRMTLQGGSYSITSVRFNGASKIVTKRCHRYNHSDKDRRLIDEMDSIARLPKKAQNLFPKLLSKRLGEKQISYDIAYVPYSNFAEVIKNSNYTANYLSSLLENIYDRLFDVLYKKIPPNFGSQLDYVKITKKRIAETLSILDMNSSLSMLLSADLFLLNGVMYDGLSQTLSRAESYLRDKKLPKTYNHGDLIFQDILVNPVSKDFRLVDSNGTSSSYIYDFSKTLMCLETKYDLIFNGNYDLKICHAANRTIVEFKLKEDAHFQKLKAMENNFWQYLGLHQERYFKNIDNWRQTLLVICGLQNLAIIMFHALRHKQEQRAAAFLVSGIKLINDSLDN